MNKILLDSKLLLTVIILNIDFFSIYSFTSNIFGQLRYNKIIINKSQTWNKNLKKYIKKN